MFNIEPNSEAKKFSLDFEKVKNKVIKSKRKKCVCRLVVLNDPLVRKINSKDYSTFFNSELLKERAIYPMKLFGEHFGFRANVRGGGISAISDAIKYGLAKAINEMCPEFKPQLKKEGLLTSDRRNVMPKKPGRPKAVKIGQKSKR